MTHDFRPGDVVRWFDGCGNKGQGTVVAYENERVHLAEEPNDSHSAWRCTVVSRPSPAPDAHPSRERALLSLGAAREALEDAINHLIKAGQPEEVAGQCVVRTRTAAEGAQQCIQHATMALYWMLHERLGS